MYTHILNTVVAQITLNQVMRERSSLLEEHIPKLATEKTARNSSAHSATIPTIIQMQAGVEAILTKKVVIYLGGEARFKTLLRRVHKVCS